MNATTVSCSCARTRQTPWYPHTDCYWPQQRRPLLHETVQPPFQVNCTNALTPEHVAMSSPNWFHSWRNSSSFLSWMYYWAITRDLVLKIYLLLLAHRSLKLLKKIWGLAIHQICVWDQQKEINPQAFYWQLCSAEMSEKNLLTRDKCQQWYKPLILLQSKAKPKHMHHGQHHTKPPRW